MPNVVVNPPSIINVRVGTASQPRIQSTSTFNNSTSGSIQEIYDEANNAYALANTAVQITGGEITGNLIVDGTFKANVDGGTF